MTAQRSRRDYERGTKNFRGRKTKREKALEGRLLGNRRGHQEEGEGPAKENRRRGESVLVQKVCSSFSGTNPELDVSQQLQAQDTA